MRPLPSRWLLAASLGLALAAAEQPLTVRAALARPVKGHRNAMHVKLDLEPKHVREAAEVTAVVTLENRSAHALKLNTLFLDLPSIVFQVRDAGGQRVALGPPPVPPDDDGVAGRKELAPGAHLSLRFKGNELFPNALPPGRYEVRYFFQSQHSAPGVTDWEGELSSPWVRLQIGS
jgi:hypothetical protein